MKISIRKKLIVHTIIVLLISLTLNTLLNSYYSRQVVENHHLNLYIPNSVKSISSEIEHHLSVPMSASQFLAGNSYLKQVILNGEKPQDIKQLVNFLRENLSSINAQTIFYVSDRSKQYYTFNGILKTIQDDGNNQDKWFFAFKASQKDIELNKDYDEATHDHFLFINCAIRDDKGNFLGSAGYGLHLNQLKQYINMATVGKKGFVYLVDRKGVIQIHRDARLEQKKLSDLENMKPHQEKILSKQSTNGLVISSPNGDKFVSSQYLPLLDWFLIAEIPSEDIFGELNEFTTTITLLNFVMISALILLIGLFISKITQPIALLHQEIISVLKQEKWDLNKRISIHRKDEIGDIALAFNQILSRFQQMILKFKDSKEDFNDQLKELSTMSNRILMISQNQEESNKVTSASIDKLTHNIKTLIDYTVMINSISQHKSQSYVEQYNLIQNSIEILNNISVEFSSILTYLQNFRHFGNTLLDQEQIDKLFKINNYFVDIKQSILKNYEKERLFLKEKNLLQDDLIDSNMMPPQYSLDSLTIEAHLALKQLSSLTQMQQLQSDAIHEISENLDLILNMFRMNENLINDVSISSNALNQLINYFNEYLEQFTFESQESKNDTSIKRKSILSKSNLSKSNVN